LKIEDCVPAERVTTTIPGLSPEQSRTGEKNFKKDATMKFFYIASKIPKTLYFINASSFISYMSFISALSKRT
jgi:hypothetical protein